MDTYHNLVFGYSIRNQHKKGIKQIVSRKLTDF